jgi:hypothetical protein
VFKLKRDEAGAIIKRKARLVARGFMQREGIDFNDIFAPVAQMESVRLLFALTAQEGWCIHHMDIKSVFLNDLCKALYGLRQAPMTWNVKLDSTLKGMSFGQSLHETAIYQRGNGGNTLLMGVYIDDLVITGTKDAEVTSLKEEMKTTFQMSDLGPLSPSTWGLRCTRVTPGSCFDRSPTPSTSLSWLDSPTATQLSF